MDRREFLKNGMLVAGATIAPQPTAERPLAGAGRLILPINRSWRFASTYTAEMTARDFDQAKLEPVTIPHTNVRLPWHSFDEKTYEFKSVYRRDVKIPAQASGQRIFVDFEGAMTASTVFLNGKELGSYRGGYTPFSFELGKHLEPSGRNSLAVVLDSSERSDIPPFGYEIDYLTFGGIYREVSLRCVPQIFIENMHTRTLDVLSNPILEVDIYLNRSAASHPRNLQLLVELRENERIVATTVRNIETPPVSPEIRQADAGQAQGSEAFADADKLTASIRLENLKNITLWELNRPHLYTVHAQLLDDGKSIDEYSSRIGFREARFTSNGFMLNGKVIKLRGLDRHQTFPWVGQAMPARVQRRDAYILRRDLRCNIVRTSHYPQSRHFLDACDEIGLLVLEEIPGWQHIGDPAWQDVAVDNVRRMVRRDWNHPSIILWGVRINESKDNHDLYTRTNTLSHALDTTRQTGGIRYLYDSELLEDVFTMNDFGWPLREPNHPLYLNTEFVGHTFPTKTIDSKERLQEHVVRHARVHDTLASNPQYAGGIGWCAFDYATHSNFGSGDRICYHGVMDIFRTPKPAAGFYKSMCDPAEEIVVEPAFHWARNDESIGLSTGLISSNCDHLKLYIRRSGDWEALLEADPDRKQFPHLPHAPFSVTFGERLRNWGDLRIDGFIDGRQVISKTYSGRGVDHAFKLLPDDTTLVADGADSTRVVVRVEDEFGNIRPFAADAITFQLSGPADLIGDNPFGLIGGTGAIWIRAREIPGVATLTATHPVLGVRSIRFELGKISAELA
jgi:beta-galactosidase